MKRFYINELALDGLPNLKASIAALFPKPTNGDAIHSCDGLLIGYYSDEATLFFNDHPSPSIGQSWALMRRKPTVVLINKLRKSDGSEHLTYGFATRNIISPNGSIARQVLINQLGTPTWINIGYNTDLIAYGQYFQGLGNIPKAS